MKKSILALCALTLAAGLSACGGGTSSYTVGGTVSGLVFPGLVLTNNLSDDVAVAPLPAENGNVRNVSYQFSRQLDYGDPYSVTVKTQPQHQVCQASGGTVETAGRLSVINAAFVCNLVKNTIGGAVTGLAADTLVLNNGGTTLALVKNADTGAYPTTFTFAATPVTYGQTYGVTVLTQPTGQTCTVANGAGTMGDDAVTSISINCVNNPA